MVAPSRRSLVAVLGALALVLGACNDGGTEPETEQPPVTDPEAADDPGDLVDPEDEAPTDPTGDLDGSDDGSDADETTDDDIDRLAGETTTGPDEVDGESGTLAVTDVRVAAHDGFDRIVFETDGDGVPGWFVEYGDATSQGSGEEVEVDGEVTLRVAIRMVTLPPELPDDIEVWDGERLEGPPAGVVAEVVDDTIFEGIHLFFVGLDEERAFVIERFADPHRVVIDVPHG